MAMLRQQSGLLTHTDREQASWTPQDLIVPIATCDSYVYSSLPCQLLAVAAYSTFLESRP
jgi:hypothetical protein